MKCFCYNTRDEFTKRIPNTTDIKQCVNLINQGCRVLLDIANTTTSWQYVSAVWFDGCGPTEIVLNIYDLLICNLKYLLQSNRIETKELVFIKIIYDTIVTKTQASLFILFESTTPCAADYHWASYRFGCITSIEARSHRFIILLNLERILIDNINIDKNVIYKMIKKCCFQDLKISKIILQDCSCSIWILAGIFYLYYIRNLRLAIYCFKKALLITKLDKIDILKHLLLIYLLLNRKNCIESCASKLVKCGMECVDNFMINVEKIVSKIAIPSLDLESSTDDWSIKALQLVNIPILCNLNEKQSIKQYFSNEENVQIMYNDIMDKKCNWRKCGKRSIKLRRCKKCKCVYYCSKLCQKRDWKMSCFQTMPHRIKCEPLSKKHCLV